MPVWVSYTALRIVVFAVPLVVLLWAGVNPYASAIVAALFGFAVSLVFLRKPRESMSGKLYAARHGEGEETPKPKRAERSAKSGPSDEDVEDDAIDGPADRG
nr:DUF4229 domain-containing protein [Agromyces seonyuensis]